MILKRGDEWVETMNGWRQEYVVWLLFELAGTSAVQVQAVSTQS
jgi:hypothetical protein